MGFFGVLAPAALSMWFPASRFGLAAGIWGIWMPAGGTLMQNLTPALNAAGGWQLIWWVALAFSVVALVLFVILYREPENWRDKNAEAQDNTKSRKPGVSVLKAFSVSLILLGIMFAIYNIVLNGTVNSHFPSFLQEQGIGQQESGFINSVITFLCIIASIAAGWISDKLGTRKWCIIVALVILLAGTWLIFDYSGSMAILWIGVILCGLFPPFVSTCTTAAVPEIIPNKENQGMGMAMLGFSASVGSFIGGIALPALTPAFGWSMGAHLLLVPLILIAIGCTFFIRVR
jgi:MFS family permease